MWQRHEDLGHGVKVDSSWWIVTKLAILTVTVGGSVLYLISLL